MRCCNAYLEATMYSRVTCDFLACVVNKSLLETPEDELDLQRVPIKDLIILAEYREREAVCFILFCYGSQSLFHLVRLQVLYFIIFFDGSYRRKKQLLPYSHQLMRGNGIVGPA